MEVIVFNGLTHLFVGIGIGVLCKFGLVDISMVALGSLIPDIDHAKSVVGKVIPVAGIFNMQHRGWTHSLLGLIIFIAIIAIINTSLIMGFALGYVLHLLVDTLTPMGIAWFYPLSKNKRHIIGIKTGGAEEGIITVSLLYLLFMWVKNWQ